MIREGFPELPRQTPEEREADFAERLSKRPPFVSDDIWGNYNTIIEGTFGRDTEYDTRWLVYMGVDVAGLPADYDEVTKRRYLGDVKPQGENNG